MLTREAQKLSLAGKTIWPLRERGTKLYFEVHPPGSGDHFRFEVELCEDLFLYALGANASPAEGKLAKCKCICIARPLNAHLPDPAYATSLNDVRKTTFVHHFHNLGNPAADVFEELTTGSGTTLDTLRTRLGAMPSPPPAF